MDYRERIYCFINLQTDFNNRKLNHLKNNIPSLKMHDGYRKYFVDSDGDMHSTKILYHSHLISCRKEYAPQMIDILINLSHKDFCINRGIIYPLSYEFVNKSYLKQ